MGPYGGVERAHRDIAILLGKPGVGLLRVGGNTLVAPCGLWVVGPQAFLCDSLVSPFFLGRRMRPGLGLASVIDLHGCYYRRSSCLLDGIAVVRT